MANEKAEYQSNGDFALDVARGFGGAIVFSVPILMTMEMWWLGFHIGGFRLALFLLLIIPVLIGLAFFLGFEETFSDKDGILDAFVAYAIGFVASALMLTLFAVVKTDMSFDEIAGKISLQAIPGAFGAMFAKSILGSNEEGEEEKHKERRSARYDGQLFLMAVGAIFLSMSLASTEEMILIGYQMTSWHAVALALVTLAMMHGFALAHVHGREPAISPHSSFLSIFLRYTIVGYAIALLISAYILWTFGRLDGEGLEDSVKAILVLGFPAAIGASASRLIL
jgi:putative integral membrane protein (TIGR02587 family)